MCEYGECPDPVCQPPAEVEGTAGQWGGVGRATGEGPARDGETAGGWSMANDTGTMGHATCRMYPMETFIMYPWQQLLVGHIQYVDLCEVLLGTCM